MRDVGYKKGRLFRQPLSMIYETYALLCYFLQQVRQFKIAFAGCASCQSNNLRNGTVSGAGNIKGISACFYTGNLIVTLAIRNGAVFFILR